MGNEDSTDKWLDGYAKKPGKQLCLKKYWTKDAKGKKVQRTCIKKKGHLFGCK